MNPSQKIIAATAGSVLNSVPTGAINEDRTIDARNRIANLTIENRGPFRKK